MRKNGEESPLEVRRGQKGLTQDAVAAKTGVSQSIIAAIETGTRTLTANLAGKLVKAFEGLEAVQLALEHVYWLQDDLPLHTCTDKAMADLGLFQTAGYDTRNCELVANMVKTLVKGNNTVDCGHGLEYYVSPNILTNNDQQKRTLTGQLQINALKSQQNQEPVTYTKSHAVLLGDKAKPVPEQVLEGKGVVIPDSKLKTAAAKVEQVQRPPSILLSSAVQDKQSNVGMRHNRMEMKYNNFVLVTKGEAI